MAYTDVGKLLEKDSERLAISFAIPYLPPSDKECIDECIISWTEQVQSLNYSSIAWYFPLNTRKLADDEGYFYPGIILFVREYKGRQQFLR